MSTETHIETAGKKFTVTIEQFNAFQRLLERRGEPNKMWLLMDRSGCVMFDYDDITIGIETDGYTHS